MVNAQHLKWGQADWPNSRHYVDLTEQSNVIVEDVHNGVISEARVREAAGRILLQKFELGLFEQPYVDEAEAAVIVGNKRFVSQGQGGKKMPSVT